jgi:hypothetical protein
MTGTGAKPAFGPADVGVAESRDYLLREGVEVFELNAEGGAERLALMTRSRQGSAYRPVSADR